MHLHTITLTNHKVSSSGHIRVLEVLHGYERCGTIMQLETRVGFLLERISRVSSRPGSLWCGETINNCSSNLMLLSLIFSLYVSVKIWHAVPLQVVLGNDLVKACHSRSCVGVADRK